ARAVDGTSYRIERSSREKPAVYRGDETRPIDVTPSDLIPIQAYGQKEIYEISQDPEFQLRLLDNYLAEDLEPLEEDEDELLRRLKDNADAILLIQEKIDTAEDRLSGLGTIREQLRLMEEQDFVERLKTKNIFEQEKRLLDRAQG